eukprot:15340451-Ditylum_brightwellii.AAC.1
MGVGDWECPISSRAIHNPTAALLLINKAPISASAVITSSASCLCFAEVGCITMDMQDHITFVVSKHSIRGCFYVPWHGDIYRA